MTPPAALDALRRADRARRDHPLRPAPRPAGGLRGAVALVGREPRGLLGGDLGALRRRRAPTTTVLASREMPGARVVPGRARSTTPGTCSAARTDDARRDPPRLRVARAGDVDVGRAARADRADPRRPRGARGRRGRPRRRLPAEHPRDDRGVPRDAPRSARSGRSAAPEFGARIVIDRFAQIEPKVLLAVDGYRYGGKDFDRARERRGDRRRDARRRARAARLPRRVGLGGRLPRAEAASSSSRPSPSTTRCGSSTARAPPGCRSRSSTATAGSCSSTSRRCTCTSTRRPDDRVFWFTTTGWMMWNFLVGVLLTEASIVLYDGNPAGDGRSGTSPPRRGITTFGDQRRLHRRRA